MDDLLPGGLYRQTHQASVRAILGDDAPALYSRGRQFFNVDRWVWRIFPGEVFRWARENPGARPTLDVVKRWIWSTNIIEVPKRLICIASTPDELDWTTARALTGGVYHETFHSLHSRTRDLFVEEVYDEIMRRWDLADWSVMGAMVEDALQYIEDVRIEQRGSDDHPGVYQPLCDLQDFILNMEVEGLEARAHGEGQSQERAWSELSTLMAAFRDLGLGYDTAAGREAIERYRQTHPDVLEMVETGPVAPLVEQAATMSASDDLGCIWLAMDLAILIQQTAESDAETEQEKKEKETAQVILVQIEGDGGNGVPGLMQPGDALEKAVALAAQALDESLEPGEQPWRPFDPSLDHISVVDGSGYEGRAQKMLSEVYGQVSFLRARLQQVVRSVSLTGREHGVRRGNRLSERTLIRTRIALMNRMMPTSAFMEEDEEIDTSLAGVVVLDQSSSMSGRQETASKTMMAIIEPLDMLRYPVMAVGFRDILADGDRPPPPAGWEADYHRVSGIHYDVFKQFDEKFRQVLPRFANTRAVHLTPMSDGIQFGLNRLRTRRETHRVLFVVTDGAPTGRHARVVRWQIRKARKEGIFIVGVGIGEGSRGVIRLFDDYVYADDLGAMPRALLHKLNDLLDFRKVTRLTA